MSQSKPHIAHQVIFNLAKRRKPNITSNAHHILITIFTIHFFFFLTEGSFDVAVLGSVVVDLTAYCNTFPGNNVFVRGNGFKMDFGGKSGNQAHMAALLRSKVALLARIPDDMLGREYKKHLEKEAVEVVQPFVPQEYESLASGVALTHTDGNQVNKIVVVENDFNFFTPSILDESKDLLETIKSCKVLTTCLTISPQTVTKALKIAKEENIFTILNPAPMPENGKDVENLRDAFQWCDVVCPNESEAAVLLGVKPGRNLKFPEIKKCLKDMEISGCEYPIVTCGAKGVYFLQHNCVKHVAAPRVEAVETLGASDCFVGALAHFVAQNDKKEISYEIVKKAVLLATESVKTRGVQSSYPDYKASVAIFARETDL